LRPWAGIAQAPIKFAFVLRIGGVGGSFSGSIEFFSTLDFLRQHPPFDLFVGGYSQNFKIRMLTGPPGS
jgi:hypothetical protein